MNAAADDRGRASRPSSRSPPASGPRHQHHRLRCLRGARARHRRPDPRLRDVVDRTTCTRQDRLTSRRSRCRFSRSIQSSAASPRSQADHANPWEVFIEKYPPGPRSRASQEQDRFGFPRARRRRRRHGASLRLDGNGRASRSWRVQEGRMVKAQVLDVGVDKERISLGIKHSKAIRSPPRPRRHEEGRRGHRRGRRGQGSRHRCEDHRHRPDRLHFSARSWRAIAASSGRSGSRSARRSMRGHPVTAAATDHGVHQGARKWPREGGRSPNTRSSIRARRSATFRHRAQAREREGRKGEEGADHANRGSRFANRRIRPSPLTPSLAAALSRPLQRKEPDHVADAIKSSIAAGCGAS